MTSFVTSSKHSGFSTAMMGSTSTSGSKQGNVNIAVAGVKGKVTDAVATESETSTSYSNDSEHKQEQRAKVTQALVSEFTLVPLKTFRLREGGLVFTDYAYYRFRKYLIFTSCS